MKMIQYYFVLLRVGDKWTPEVTEETRQISEGHRKNIEKLVNEGKLLLAGPFEEEKETTSPGDLDGLFILAVGTKAEALALLAEDPAIRSGRMVAEVHPWWGPSGIRFDKG